MRKICLVLLALTIGINLFGVEVNRKFGKVSKEELAMTVYEKDSSAEALILFDIGETDFDYNQQQGFQMVFKRHVRIKILNEDGFDLANFKLELYHNNGNREKLSGLKAVTYNLENGKIKKIKLDKKNIFDIEDTKNLDFKKFSLPSIKVGSVIEVSYTITSDFFYNLQKWNFQYSIPSVWSEYTVQIPEYFRYNRIGKGYLPYTLNENERRTDYILLTSKERTIGVGNNKNLKNKISTDKIQFFKDCYKLAVKDAPALEREAFMLSPDNYISGIEFELSQIQYPNRKPTNYAKSWESITDNLIENSSFGGQLKMIGFTSEVVENVKSKTENQYQQIKMLYEYVKDNYSWNGRTGVYTTKSLRKTFKDKVGNSSDLNLLMVALLKEAGFNVNPVILSTRNHGLLNIVNPSVSQMNYVIALVKFDDKDILLDATDPDCKLGILPPRCINDKGRVISKTNSRWINLEPTDQYALTVYADMKIDEDAIDGSVVINSKDYAAYRLRKSYKKFNNENEYIADFESNNPGIKINEFNILNIDSIQKPVQYQFSNVSIDSYDNLGNMIYFNPVVFDRIEENPFKLEERSFPIDFNYKYNQRYIFNYTIPEGYFVEEMPKSVQYELPNNKAIYKYIIKQIGNKVTLTMLFNINKRQFLPEDYNLIKDLYNNIISKETEQIILKKN